MFRKKNICLYIWILYWLPSAKYNAHAFIYKKSKRNETFLYTKIKTLYVTQFLMNFLKLAFIYKNHETLSYVRFLYIKNQKICKNKDNFRYVFIYKNKDTFRYAIFHWIFEIGVGGVFLSFKKMHFALHFIYKYKCLLHYGFIYKNPDTLCYIVICKKQCPSRYVFICKIYIV